MDVRRKEIPNPSVSEHSPSSPSPEAPWEMTIQHKYPCCYLVTALPVIPTHFFSVLGMWYKRTSIYTSMCSWWGKQTKCAFSLRGFVSVTRASGLWGI